MITVLVLTSATVAVSLEDVGGLAFQRFGDKDSGRLVHLGFFPMVTGVRLGVHRVAEGGLVLGGLAGGSTNLVSRDGLDDERTTFLSVGPRIGWHWGQGATLGAWARVGPTLRWASGATRLVSLDLSAEAHLVWTFAPSVALLFGPSIDLGLAARKDRRHTGLGLLAGLRVAL